MPKKAIFTTLFLGWVLVITGLSLFDFSPDNKGIEIPYLDKLVHFTFYFVFVVLGGMVLKYQKMNTKPLRNLIFLIALAIFYGLVMEGLQSLLPVDRTAEIWDVLANTIGAIMGGTLIKTHLSRSHASK